MHLAKLTYMNTKGQSHLLTWVLDSSDSVALNFYKTTGLIETKLHIEPQWGWEVKVCSCNRGHMTKMAVMPIYGKKGLKFFISGSERPMTLKLGR